MSKLIKPEVRKWLKWPVAIVLILGWIGAGAWFWGVIVENLASIILVVLAGESHKTSHQVGFRP